MRIGIDARAAAEVPAGRGRYVRELLKALARRRDEHEYLLYGRTPWKEVPFEWRLIERPDPVWSIAAARAAGSECDVVLASNSYLLAALSRVPAAAVVYDLVAFDRALGAPKGSLFERITLPLAVRRARTMICISEATRVELVARYPRARAEVIPLAADPRFFDAQPAPRERPFVLCTGTLEPRKNVPRLIEAFAALPAELRDRYELVLAGPEGWQTRAILDAIGAHGDFVTALGYVPEDELPGLYAAAEVFAYPSLQEGFGLPVLEAMAAGTPVVTSNVSSLPEVAGDAALLVDPLGVTSIRDGIERLLRDEGLRAELAIAGRARAGEFGWDLVAERTLAAIRRIH